jgi:hypothetical protein
MDVGRQLSCRSERLTRCLTDVGDEGNRGIRRVIGWRMSHEVSLDSLFEVGSMQVESSRRSDHLAAFDDEQ